MGIDASDLEIVESAFGFFQGAFGAPSEPVSVADPDPQPQLQDVTPDYGEPFYDTGRPYLPADSAGLPFPVQEGEIWQGAIFETEAEPSWLDRTWDILGSTEIKPLRDSLLNKYVLQPETETVNTAGRTETHVNPQAAPARGSVPVSTIPQSTVFFPWQQPGDIGDAPKSSSGLGIPTSALVIGGLVLFFMMR